MDFNFTISILIAPYFIRTMSDMCHGVTFSLISRAADVVLKEKRRLVVLVRETLLTLSHIRTMNSLTYRS